MPSASPDRLRFDLLSYGRAGPGRRDRFSQAQVQQIARTVGRTPEVMVKVLPRGATSVAAVRKHVDYLDRKGKLDLETDDGVALRGRQAAKVLVDDWDLDLDEQRGRMKLTATRTRQAPKLIHKVLFSMPAGTPPEKVLSAVRILCREEFALKHRYAMALHTDQPHPHVHVIVKAISEDGERLHISNEMLRRWREDFARHLRELGVAANATARYVRGVTKPRKSDGIFRASLRGDSTHMRERAAAVARELAHGSFRPDQHQQKLLQSRDQVRRAWAEISGVLSSQGQAGLAAQASRFAEDMPAPLTERSWLARELMSHLHAERSRDGPTR